jgi:hypothetical protein
LPLAAGSIGALIIRVLLEAHASERPAWKRLPSLARVSAGRAAHGVAGGRFSRTGDGCANPFRRNRRAEADRRVGI